jgi:hypothetical protein
LIPLLAARGWRRTDDGRNTRHVLGCADHGADCRRRVAIRNSCVAGARRPAPNCSRIAYLPQKLCLEYFPVLTVVSSFQRLTSSLQRNVLVPRFFLTFSRLDVPYISRAVSREFSANPESSDGLKFLSLFPD